MLASGYRFAIDNQSGGAISAATVDVTPWKFDADGVLIYRAGGAHNLTFTTPINDNSQAESDSVNNISDGNFLGAHLLINVTSAGSGDILVYLQSSLDTVSFPNQYNVLIAVLNESSGSPVSHDLEI